MFTIVRTYPAFRSSGNVCRRRPRSLADGAVRAAGLHDDAAHPWRTRCDVEPTCRAFHPRDRGTSLARTTAARLHDICDMSVSSKTSIAAQALRARVKMLSNEIVFDIRRAVPEHVRPTHEQLLDWHRTTRRVRYRSGRHASSDDPGRASRLTRTHRAAHSCRRSLATTSHVSVDVGSRASA